MADAGAQRIRSARRLLNHEAGERRAVFLEPEDDGRFVRTERQHRLVPRGIPRLDDRVGVEGVVGQVDLQPRNHGAERVLALRQQAHRVARHIFGDGEAVAIEDVAAWRGERQGTETIVGRLELEALVFDHLGLEECRRQDGKDEDSTAVA